MRRLNLHGVNGVCGISTAYKQTAAAIKTVCNVSSAEDYDDFYVHGLPRSTRSLIHIPKFLDGNNIAYWMWESSELAVDFAEHATYYSEIWTASNYCKSIFETLGKPVKLVPHCVNDYKYNPDAADDVPVILVAFNCDSRVSRKNPFFALEALNKLSESIAFKVKFKVSNSKSSLLKYFKKQAESLDCEWITDSLTRNDLLSLYDNCDILFSPHKSEGFGLHMIEMMAMGKKVVATGYSGNMDFCNDENSYLIDYKLDAVDDEFYLGEWAYPELDSAVDCLKAACKDGQTKNFNGFNTALSFNSANLIKHTLRAL